MQGFAADLFAGKRVVVTGAGRGIGAAVARGFLSCGASVVAHAGRTEDYVGRDLTPGLSDDALARLTVLTADLSMPGGGEALAEAVLSGSPHVDILINNAGTMGGRTPAEETPAAYDAILDLNIRATVALTAALLPRMRAAERAAIVNTVSISARTGGSAGSSLYSGAKAFIATWSRALARELAPDGIRVNAVSPGTIMTDFHRRYSSDEKLRATAAAIPLQRLGTPEDCAPAFLFLASDLLSDYVTGQVIEINGGQFMG